VLKKKKTFSKKSNSKWEQRLNRLQKTNVLKLSWFVRHCDGEISYCKIELSISLSHVNTYVRRIEINKT